MISYGKGDLGRIYEKLRKRSARRHQESEAGWAAFDEWEREVGSNLSYTEYEDQADSLIATIDNYTTQEHRAYVRGVREALEAVLGTHEGAAMQEFQAYESGFADGAAQGRSEE